MLHKCVCRCEIKIALLLTYLHGPIPVQQMFRDRTEATSDQSGPGPGPRRVLTLLTTVNIRSILPRYMTTAMTQLTRSFSVVLFNLMHQFKTTVRSRVRGEYVRLKSGKLVAW